MPQKYTNEPTYSLKYKHHQYVANDADDDEVAYFDDDNHDNDDSQYHNYLINFNHI